MDVENSLGAAHITRYTFKKDYDLYAQTKDVTLADVLSRPLRPAFSLFCVLGYSKKAAHGQSTFSSLAQLTWEFFIRKLWVISPKLCGISNWCSTFNK